MLVESDHIPACTHLLFAIKNLERIGDHATNIAETIQFLVAGKHVAERRPKHMGGEAGEPARKDETPKTSDENTPGGTP
jgi:hypothetical protein